MIRGDVIVVALELSCWTQLPTPKSVSGERATQLSCFAYRVATGLREQRIEVRLDSHYFRFKPGQLFHERHCIGRIAGTLNVRAELAERGSADGARR